ncbi:helix-turn-helix domain-containing protein [Nonomuraea sp. NPDC050790]|uniref:AraC-like ligand-binding domain-containing protein n=1 Tax=Nonomuraea sp. NPDC050790 TaxID=3364371 RepID=UPI0037AF51A0
MRLRTSDVPAHEREELWRHTVARSFVPLDFAFEAACSGEITGRRIGRVVVTEVTAGPHRAERTERHVRSSAGPAFYKLSLPVSGRLRIRQDGRDTPLQPGDLTIYDTSRPYQVVFDGTCRVIVVMFPRQELRLPQRAMREVTARRVAGGRGLGGVVCPLLVNLVGHLDEIGAVGAERLADNIVDLVATLYASCLGEHAAAPASPLRERVKAVIAARLGEPGLGPEAVAAACHVSPGYLHKLFRAEGVTVSRYIRDLRLERCRRDLLDPAARHVAVRAVGARWGFADAAHFSRVFKAEYGLAPHEYRLSRHAGEW